MVGKSREESSASKKSNESFVDVRLPAFKVPSPFFYDKQAFFLEINKNIDITKFLLCR